MTTFRELCVRTPVEAQQIRGIFNTAPNDTVLYFADGTTILAHMFVLNQLAWFRGRGETLDQPMRPCGIAMPAADPITAMKGLIMALYGCRVNEWYDHHLEWDGTYKEIHAVDLYKLSRDYNFPPLAMRCRVFLADMLTLWTEADNDTVINDRGTEPDYDLPLDEAEDDGWFWAVADRVYAGEGRYWELRYLILNAIWMRLGYLRIGSDYAQADLIMAAVSRREELARDWNVINWAQADSQWPENHWTEIPVEEC